MAVEWFTRKAPRMGTPLMTFSKIGQVFFNQSATRILQKEPIEYILLGWDSTDNKMVMKAISNKKDPRAYHIKYSGKGNGASFSAKTFLDFIEVDYTERKPIPIEIKMDAENFLEVKLPEGLLKKKQLPLRPVAV